MVSDTGWSSMRPHASPPPSEPRPTASSPSTCAPSAALPSPTRSRFPTATNRECSGVPVTYVPARNTVLLALLLGHAEVMGAVDLFIGANAVDYSGYPDCRPAFLDAFAALANLATVAGAEYGARFQVHAPLIDLTKAEIILRGIELGLDYGLTHSCYDPDADGRACGDCDSCTLRRRGFEAAGVLDPTRYS